MRLRHSFLAVVLVLPQYVLLTHAESFEDGDVKGGKKDAVPLGPDPALTPNIIQKGSTSQGVGTKDAPVDGKDGRPHEGPFIETAAERDRKKAKESGNDEVLTAPKKPPPKDLNGASYKDGWSLPMPESNDGVMDDPDRVGPKEGTRGTEGGISEKNRDRLLLEDSSGGQSEKKPDQPKEAPPLPHSEQEKVPLRDSIETAPEDEKMDDAQKEIGGLEVRLCRRHIREA